MQLTVHQAASYLGVKEATVRRWIALRGLPAHRVNERLHLNAIELWEWATENGIAVSRRLLDLARRRPDDVAPLSELLAAGGIHHDVGGEGKTAVLREIVARLPLPADADREFLVTVLEAREAMGSTGIGGGIAIPHVRNPIVLHIDAPFVTLCLVRHPVDFDAVDGKPVHALFTLISPSVPTHLRMLAQLGFVLRDDGLRKLLGERAGAFELLACVRALEQQTSGMHPAAPAPVDPIADRDARGS
jgi:PTS system nitrogen regulatory IIA component